MPDVTSVSVVVPAYNAANLIGAAISSALGQSQPAEEILVVDDGSQDATAMVAGAYPAPVRLLQQANEGVAAARNSAIKEATGEFIALLDADDQLLPQHIERCMGVWRSRASQIGHERVIVTGNAYRLTRQGLTTSTILPARFPPPHQQRQQILQANFTGIFVVYPRRLHDEIGLYDQTLRRGEDRDLWTRALFSGWHIVAQREPHAIYRMGEKSLGADNELMAAAEQRVLAKTRGKFGPTLTPAEEAYLEMRLSSPTPRELIHSANDSIRTSSWPDAAAQLRQASHILPSSRSVRLRAWMANHALTRPVLSLHLRASDRRLGRVPR